MRLLRMKALVLAFTLAGMASIALAQGPIQKRVNYTINVKHSLRMGDYLLPPGKYVIYQFDRNDLNLFALYQEDLTNEPIAMIRTTRIDYHTTQYPEDTQLILEMDEDGYVANPVLRGWNIPGMDGWEIISVVSKNDRVLTRIK